MKKLFVLLFVLTMFSSCQITNQEVVEVTVTEKERVVTEDSSKYLIYTENEVFENTDYLFKWKFNSSDLYGKIKVGETYIFEVGGVRIPFLSTYRNIHKIRD